MATEDKSKPFEIRKDILHLAKDILSENMHMKNDHAHLRENAPGVSISPAVLTYSTEDVIKEAEKLYTFVSKR